MKKLLTLILWLAFPVTSLAVTSVSWTQTNLTDTFITPNPVNGLLMGLQVKGASSTLQAFTFTNATGTNATTTNFKTTNLYASGLGTARIPYISSNGLFVTTSALQFDDTLNKLTVTSYQGTTGTTTSATSTDLYTTNLGVNSEYFNDLTGNGLSLSAGALNATLGTTIAPNELVGQPFTANFPLVVNTAGTGFVATTGPLYMDLVAANSTSTNATSTNLFATTASSTNLFGTLINGFGLATCNSSSNALTWAAGVFGCNTIAGSGGSGGGTWATTTSTHAGRLINYPLNDTDVVVVGASATTTAEYYFDPNLPLAKINNQYFGLSSTTLQNFTAVNGTTTNATSTTFAVSGLTANSLVASNALGGLVSTSTIGNNQLQNSTISTIPLGGTLANLTATDGTLTFSGTYTGATARTIGLNLANANTWTGGQTFGNATATTYALTSTSNAPVIGAYSVAANSYDLSTASTWRAGINSTGQFAVASSTPWASVLSLGAPAGTAPYLAIGSSTGRVLEVNPQTYASIAAGTSTPNAIFALNATTTASAAYLNILDVSSSTSATAYADVFRINMAGGVFIPKATQSAGAQTYVACGAATTFEFIWDTLTCATSAAKYKTNVHDLDIGLKELLEVRPVVYNWKPTGNQAYDLDRNVNHQQIGLIADEVEKIDSRLVTYDKEGEIHGFNYEQYTAWLTKAIQELNTKVEATKRSAEENWQWLVIGLLALGMGYQQWQIRQLQK